jgi:hypothetical protein
VNKTSSYQSSASSTPEEIAAARAGLGCASNADQPVIDPDAKADDLEVRQIKTTRGKDILTSIANYSVTERTDEKLLLTKSLLSYSSVNLGELLLAPVESNLSCDPKLAMDKACGGALTALEQTDALKKNMSSNGLSLIRENGKPANCRVAEIDHDSQGHLNLSEKDELGNYVMHNGRTIKVLQHTKTVAGKIVCGMDHLGHGVITEQVLLSRDVVGVAELVACGGVQVVKAKTVTVDSGDVVFSQRSEIVDTKAKL